MIPILQGQFAGKPIFGGKTWFPKRHEVVLQEARYHHLQNCFGYVEESSNHGEVVGMATLFMAPGMVTGGSSQVSKIIHLTSKRLISVFIVISGSCSRMGTSRVQESMGWTATVWWAGSGSHQQNVRKTCVLECFRMFFPLSHCPFPLGRFWTGYGSIPINTIFRGMNIHLPAILMFTRGTRFWHTAN